MKAMVVDDSRAMRMLMTRELLKWGFEVVQAGDGRQGLETLEKEQGAVRLVMVDWNMPVMDGLEFVQHVRASPNFAAVRIIMVTTETEIEQMSRALEAGADEYIMKPFTTEAVEDKLNMLGVLA